MRTAICLIAFVLAKSNSQGGLTEGSNSFAAIVMTACIVMDIIDFVLNVYHKTKNK